MRKHGFHKQLKKDMQRRNVVWVSSVKHHGVLKEHLSCVVKPQKAEVKLASFV